MSVLTTSAIIDRIERFSPPTPANARSVPSRDADLEEAWRQIINYKLIEWGRNPSQFDDEDTDGLTPAAVQASSLYALRLRDSHVRVPDWVVPSGNGGVTLSWGEHGGEINSLEIDSLGKGIFIRMNASKVLERESVEALEASR